MVAAMVATAVAWFGWRSIPLSHPPSSAHAPTFVGSTACAGCHAGEFAAWKGSQHALAMQPATVSTVLGDFSGSTFVHGGVKSTFFERDGQMMARTDGSDGKPADFDVKYTFGVQPLQQYLIAMPGGRLQALSVAWDSRSKDQGGARWFHLYEGQSVDHRDELHWTQRAQNWNFMCADCHSTDIRKNYDAATDSYSTTWAELSVGCEACHGPASNHVAWAAAKGHDPAMGLTVTLDERRNARWSIDAASGNATRNHPRPSDAEIEVCAACHARRAQIAEGWRAGNHFLDHYRPALLEPPLYHPDGQQRDEVYIWGSFLQSRMYQQGVTCGDCHEPHGAKLRVAGNALCSQCHLATRYDTATHHHHAGGNAGTQCVECHMPPTTYMRVDPRRDHGLRIPRPDLTVSIGTPNACGNCHADRSAQWAADAARRWYGHDPQGLQQYATTFAGAARGDPHALPALDALAFDASQPAIARATALAFLARTSTPESIAAGRRATGDADALVRHASIDTLASLPPDARWNALAPLLGDPLRVIRIDAASALADAPAATSNAAWQRAAAEYEATQRYLADRPEARTALGTFYARQRRLADAETQFRSAIALDAAFVPAYVNFADFYRAQHRDADAEHLLREGIDQAPGSGMLQHALGLTLVRLGRKDDALQPLQRATMLAPDDARFAYVYAVGLYSSGRPALAIAELKRALARNPDNRDLVGALASIQREAGVPAARAAGQPSSRRAPPNWPPAAAPR